MGLITALSGQAGGLGGKGGGNVWGGDPITSRTINWNTGGAAPGPDIEEVVWVGGSGTPNAPTIAGKNAANKNSWYPPREYVLKLEQPEHATITYNHMKAYITPAGGAWNLSQGLRAEILFYEDIYNNDTARANWQLISDESGEAPYIIARMGCSSAPDQLLFYERNNSITETLLTTDNGGGNAAAGDRYYWKFRTEFPANLSGDIKAQVWAMGSGGYNGTERSVALKQDYSAGWPDVRLRFYKECWQRKRVREYIDHIWLGSVNDDWPA